MDELQINTLMSFGPDKFFVFCFFLYGKEVFSICGYNL